MTAIRRLLARDPWWLGPLLALAAAPFLAAAILLCGYASPGG